MKQVLIDLNEIEGDFKIEEDMEILAFIPKNRNVKKEINFIVSKPQIQVNILIKSIVGEDQIVDIFANLVVPKGMNESDSYLRLEALLTSEKATANLAPALEVESTNVKAGHGATIRTFIDDELNYLRSRGLSKNECYRVLEDGFIADFQKKIVEENRSRAETLFNNRSSNSHSSSSRSSSNNN